MGITCEIEVVKEDYCPGNGNQYCVNGGTCRVKAANFTKQPCRCPDGFLGHHCQYRQEDLQSDCLLTCSNHGSCQHGMNPFDDKGANSLLDLPDDGTSNFMHCICENNYAGTNCEYEATKCGGRKRYCFHGSECVDVEGGLEGGGDEICECTDNDGKKCK